MPKSANRIKNVCEVNTMIESGDPITKISVVGGVTNEGARNYIKRIGKFESWKEKRKEVKKNRLEKIADETLTKQSLVDVLCARVYRLAQESGWAYVKAWDYYSNVKKRGKHNIPLVKLVKLFDLYETALKHERILSLEEFFERTGIGNINYISQIFQRVGLTPMNCSKERKYPEDYIKEKIKSAGRELNISSNDAGYFLGVSSYISDLYWKRYQLRNGIRVKPLMHLGIYGQLTHKKASEIYEAQDLGFSKEETLDLLDINPGLYDFTMRNRKVIQKKIVNVLDTLWPEFKHTKPYVDHPKELPTF